MKDRLRQCVDHPLLVMNKGTEDDELNESILNADGGEEQSLKQMIAMYAGGDSGAEDGEKKNAVDPAYALKVLKEMGEAENTPECPVCGGEIFDEVLLPCYHRG